MASRERLLCLIWGVGVLSAVAIALLVVPAAKHHRPVFSADRDVVPKVLMPSPADHS